MIFAILGMLVPLAILIGIVSIIAVIINNRKEMEPTTPGAPARPKTTPKDFFLHVGAMIALYVCVGSLLALLFTVIDRAFPDALQRTYDYGYYYYESGNSTFRMSASILIVLFPVLWLISWYLGREYAANPERRAIPLRKWLVYLTLFLAGATIVGDLVTLIYKFLGGEISVRFIMKALSTLAVSGIVFGYFFYDLREDLPNGAKLKKIFIWIAAALILVSVGTGIAVMGSPMSQRLMQFDMQKTNDLMTLQGNIINYWQRKAMVPAKLDDVNDPLSSYMSMPNDPQTGAPYEYRKTGAMSFELCATYNYESAREENNTYGGSSMARPNYRADANQNWEHGKGRTCFKRTIDPQLYPVYNDNYGKPMPPARPASGVSTSTQATPGIPDDPGDGSGNF